MAEGAVSMVGQRVFVGDARDNGGFLRVTWHGEEGQFVVSNWEGNLCVGATRVRIEDTPELIGVLARGLADAGARGAAPPPPAQPPTLRHAVATWWQARRGDLAPVLPFVRRPRA